MGISLADAMKKYGPVEGGHWRDEAKHCTFAPIPDQLIIVNSLTKKRMERIYCNVDIAPALARAMLNIAQSDVAHHLETFDGCLMPRDVRGHPGQLSTHAYALAVDFNAADNALGTRGKMHAEVVRFFKQEGFAWGGDFSRCDPMHFSLAWERALPL